MENQNVQGNNLTLSQITGRGGYKYLENEILDLTTSATDPYGGNVVVAKVIPISGVTTATGKCIVKDPILERFNINDQELNDQILANGFEHYIYINDAIIDSTSASSIVYFG